LHVEYLARHPELAAPTFTAAVRLAIERRIALFALVPLLSMTVAFVSTHVALYVYLLLATAHFLPGRIDAQIAAAERNEGRSAGTCARPAPLYIRTAIPYIYPVTGRCAAMRTRGPGGDNTQP
jgi:hypothetical protein